MKILIFVLFMMTSIFLFFSLFQMFFKSDKKMERRMKSFLKENDQKELDKRSFHFLVQTKLFQQSVQEKLKKRRNTKKLEQKLISAGISIRPEEFVMFRMILSIISGLTAYLIFNNWFMILFGFCFIYFGSNIWIKMKQKKRIKMFNDGLSDMITTLISSLRAGFSLVQSFQSVIEECESPLKEEIGLMIKEMQYGLSLEEALNELKERMPSEDLDLMIQSILIQRQIGGNLSVILETIEQTIRDRNKIQGQISTLTAQGRLSGWVIGSMPIAVGFIIFLIEPEYFKDFFKHPIGIMLIVAGVISGTIGFILIKKITTIEV
ncbi:type II secretion system F family protein [Chengkuizengella axinellae]|uniref:Type II secretion system F family protein n=1 Tax=Chengkuizengella axinellae TaxID=3064388 RepID=A0ABT9IYP9_9BACL|nr:type II secretion system F family protein [Chengkuizengella sp. 2205SS18-9]MDP5274496.1 type II secretion system F family protein [Chengkuizengella sp. 2205SS18-9]